MAKGKHMTLHGHEGVVEEGSKQNGGRRIFVWHEKGKDGKWHTHSENYARAEVEKELHHALSKRQHVDHKDSDHMHDGKKNLHVMSAHDNIAKENKRRAKK